MQYSTLHMRFSVKSVSELYGTPGIANDALCHAHDIYTVPAHSMSVDDMSLKNRNELLSRSTIVACIQDFE